MPIVTVGFSEMLEDGIKELTTKMAWMANHTMRLCKSLDELRTFVDQAIGSGRCAVDTETTSLNTRMKSIRDPLAPNGIRQEPCAKIVAFCLAFESALGLYIPVGHQEDEELNLPLDAVLEQINRLCKNCITIYHNAKYDLAVLKNYGIVIDRYEHIEDTEILSRIYDTGVKFVGLKPTAEKILGRKMLEIGDVSPGSKRLDLVSPKLAATYGASDAICTLDLFLYFISQQIVKDQMPIYNLEKRTLFVVLSMESNYVKIDVDYLMKAREVAYKKLNDIRTTVHQLAGKEFNLGSTQQLGKLLFDDLGYAYPDKRKTATGQYKTDTATLEKIAKQYPIVESIIEYRGLEKCVGTYVEKLIANHDEEGCVKLGFKQTGTDTGRFSSPGGMGIDIDGYCGINVQSLPGAKKGLPVYMPDIRRSLVARPGYTIVAMDYSGEELRVATNLSREPKWMEEFLHGDADIHSATARAIFQKNEITEAERGAGKTINFLVMYGGGSRGLAEQAHISEREAKRLLDAFFKGLPTLKKWIDREILKARKLKYSKTAFGRVRPLHMFYDSGDRGSEAHADRCAVNHLVQGCLQPQERILTSRGYVPILEVKNRKESGEDFKVWTGTSWEDFDVLDMGMADYANIELQNGMSLRGDVRHSVLTLDQHKGYVFQKYDELTKESKVCVSVPHMLDFGEYPVSRTVPGKVHNSLPITVDSKKKWDFIAYLMGYLTGDGSIYYKEAGHASKAVLKLCMGKEDLVHNYPYIKDSMQRFFGISLSDPILSKGSIGDSYVSSFNSMPFCRLLKDLGYSFSTAWHKKVPKSIFESPAPMRTSFLRGYFDSDGYHKNISGRCTLHTPNKNLLREIQLVAWTLGLSSKIYKTNQNTYRLGWEDMDAITEILFGQKFKKRRCNNPGMYLPKFLRQPVVDAIRAKKYKHPFDRAYIYRFRHESKPVSLQGTTRFLKDYGIDFSELPPMYYHYKVKSRTVTGERGRTYTLRVHDQLHRYDSAGIISKNCSADIIKTAMVRVFNYIQVHNLQDDIKILITMHDELVYEIKTEKLHEYIPILDNIMRLEDILQGILKWPVPLALDSEYGETWHVTNDFFEENPDARLKTPILFQRSEGAVSSEGAKDIESAPEKLTEEKIPPLGREQEPNSEISDVKQEPKLAEFPIENTKSKEISEGDLPQDLIPQEFGESPEAPPEKNEDLLKNDLTSPETVIYTIRDRKTGTLRKLNDVLLFLTEEGRKDVGYQSPKRIVVIRDVEGNLLSEIRVHSDAFLALSRYYGL